MKVHLELLKYSIAAAPTTLLLAALCNPQSAYAQQVKVGTDSNSAMAGTPAAPTDSAVGEPKDKEQPAMARHHGIQIHGHWVIDVRNPDGKLVEHREFENSLVKVGTMMSGDQLLAGVLSGNLAVGDPGIGLVQGTPGGDPSTFCNTNLTAQLGNSVAPNTTCYGLTTAVSGMTSYLANFTTGLTSTVTFSPKVNWVLSGNYAAPPTLSSISAVQTLIATCFPLQNTPEPYVVFEPPFASGGFVASTNSSIQFGGTTSVGRYADFPSNLCAPSGNPPTLSQTLPLSGTTVQDFVEFVTLTSTKLSTPLAVSAGQVITVTVTISFT